jgi:hypothetical protein
VFVIIALSSIAASCAASFAICSSRAIPPSIISFG